MAYKKLILTLLRISLGWIFFWPFLDKLFGLGFSTLMGNGWLSGASPTYGFLTFAAKGPFAEYFNGMAGMVLVDWIFMLGLLGIGVALLLGIGMRIAAISGTLQLLMMWAAVLPPEHNPVVDDHIVYSLVLLFLITVPAKSWYGLSELWQKSHYVKTHPFLK